MNHVASPMAPSERIRGAASGPDTSQPATISPPGGGRRHGIRSGIGKEGGSDDDKRSRRARLDGTDDLASLTTVEPLQGTPGHKEVHGGKRQSKLPPTKKSEGVSFPISGRHHRDFLGMSEPWSKPGTANGPNEPGPKNDALP